MEATRAKTEYLTKVRLERFVSLNLPNVWLVTMTFHENVIDKKEAMKRWKPVADWLKRHGIDWCGVWQQQKRGAWHHHFLVNKYIDVVSFREFVVARRWGQFVNIEAVGLHHGGRRFQDANRVVKYLTRYLTRDLCGHVPIRVRLTSGCITNKIGTTRFNWVGGLARVWRVGCSILGYQPKWNDYKAQRDLWRRGCLRLGLSYIEVMQRLLGLQTPRREGDSSSCWLPPDRVKSNAGSQASATARIEDSLATQPELADRYWDRNASQCMRDRLDVRYTVFRL